MRAVIAPIRGESSPDVRGRFIRRGVLHTSGASSPYIASSKAKKTVLMGGSFNAGALVQHIAAISGDAFMARGVLPMFGAGADNVVYLSAGFESGAVVPNGFSYSSAGFCRLYGFFETLQSFDEPLESFAGATLRRPMMSEVTSTDSVKFF